MTLPEIIRANVSRGVIDENGSALEMTLEPGLTDSEIATFEERIGFTLPETTRDLLRFTNGLTGGPLVALDFSSSSDYVGVDEENKFSPRTIGFAADGCGNHWGYALGPDATDLGPIFYFCHDAPVFLYQSPDLRHFLVEMFKLGEPSARSLIREVREDNIKNVWTTNPDLVPVVEARNSPDPVIADFARSLPDDWKLIDLRKPEIGDGFSWGRCREFKRHDRFAIFGLDFRRPWTLGSWLKELFRFRPAPPNTHSLQ